MRRGRRLLFVEVKAKEHDRYGDPLEMVTEEKQRRLRRAAEGWLAGRRELMELELGFEVVAVRQRRLERMAVVLAVFSVALGGCGGGGCAKQGKLLQAIERAATRLGDATPSGGSYVRTTQNDAVSVFGGHSLAHDRQVFFVVLRGRFGGRGLRNGGLADFSIDARTYRLVDFGTSNRLPPLSFLGPVRRVDTRSCVFPS